MNRKKRLLVPLAVLGLSVLAAGAALAGRGGRGPAGGPWDGSGRGPFAEGRLVRELDLTLEQRDALRAAVDAHWNGGLHAAADLERDARHALRRQIHDPAATEEQLRATARAMTDAAAQVAILRHRLFAEIHALLTPEQQATLRRLEVEREERAERRHRAFDAWMGTREKTDS